MARRVGFLETKLGGMKGFRHPEALWRSSVHRGLAVSMPVWGLLRRHLKRRRENTGVLLGLPLLPGRAALPVWTVPPSHSHLEAVEQWLTDLDQRDPRKQHCP